MPGFFLIAGFFSAMTLASHSPEEFLERRVRRLAVPFLVFTLIDIVLNVPNHNTWGDYSVELSGRYWTGGDWLEHLWFLVTLISYVLVVFFVQKLCPSIDSRMRKLKIDLGGFIALLAIGCFVTQHIERVFPGAPWSKLWFWVDQVKFFDFCAWFGAGYFLFLHRELFERFNRLVLFNAAGIILFWLLARYVEDLPFSKYFVQLWETVYVLNVCGLLFWIARRFFNSENRLVRSVSDASYTMYLVHWPIVVVLNRLLNHQAMPIGLVFVLFVFAATVLSYAFHLAVVRKSDLLMFLLNGRQLAIGDTEVAAPPVPPVLTS